MAPMAEEVMRQKLDGEARRGARQRTREDGSARESSVAGGGWRQRTQAREKVVWPNVLLKWFRLHPRISSTSTVTTGAATAARIAKPNAPEIDEMIF
jgi:hypothetical protein